VLFRYFDYNLSDELTSATDRNQLSQLLDSQQWGLDLAGIILRYAQAPQNGSATVKVATGGKAVAVRFSGQRQPHADPDAQHHESAGTDRWPGPGRRRGYSQ
jgi:hypothetical protein